MFDESNPRFLNPAWSVAQDLIKLGELLEKGGYFLARPVSIRRQGPIEHWKTRNRKKLEDDF